MSSTLYDPRVIDASTLTPKASAGVFLPIGIEGQAGAAGSAVVGNLYTINRLDQAVTIFDATSPIYRIIRAVLDRGAGPVLAIASAKGATLPTLVQRQAAWAKLEADVSTRIRLTDSVIQAELASHAVSVANANLLFNKQVALVGMPSGTSKAALLTAATAIAAGGVDAATRTALIGPGVYDYAGVLRDGSHAAAALASEVAKNDDLGMDLDLWDVPILTGVELGSDGRPVFQRSVVAGTAVDDYEDLLVGGVSPLQPSRIAGGVATTHIRTVYVTDTSYDNLYTRLIVDQIFIDVRNYILDNNFLRAGNTDTTRARIASGVTALLVERSSWISTVLQGDGTQGYNVTVVPSPDNRQITVGYEGVVVRGINTVKVAANLTIPA